MKRLINIVVICLVSYLVCCAVVPSSGLTGKNVAVLGDSMSWIGGDDCSKPNGWTNHFRLLVSPATIRSYARSGATWTNTTATRGDTLSYSEVLDDENVLYNQALRLVGAAKRNPALIPDVIILYAGANDAWFQNRRPGIFSGMARTGASPSSNTSITSSIELVCSVLRAEFPEARMVFVTPMEMSKVSVDRVKRVADVIDSVGRRLGADVIRADLGVDIRHDREKQRPTYTTDGVHTNEKGAVMLAEYICRQLNK